MVRDQDDKPRGKLPSANVRDDPAKVALATERWNRLKTQVLWAVKAQADRLERAMVAGRRWSPAEFEARLVHHPFLIHLVRRILWGQFDESGSLVSTFRVSEERDYSDVHEAGYRLDGDAKVGIVHPVQLSDGEISAWSQAFAEHEILPPFSQLGREFFRLTPDQRDARELVRIKGVQLPEKTLSAVLRRDGWTSYVRRTDVYEQSRLFGGSGVMAVILAGNVKKAGGTIDWNQREILTCFFVPATSGTITDSEYHPLPLGAVDPVVLSEVLTTLEELASKGN